MHDEVIAGHPIDVSLRATIRSLKQLSNISEGCAYGVQVQRTASNHHNDNDGNDGGQSTTRQCEGTLLRARGTSICGVWGVVFASVASRWGKRRLRKRKKRQHEAEEESPAHDGEIRDVVAAW
jgi:hypothetical protein